MSYVNDRGRQAPREPAVTVGNRPRTGPGGVGTAVFGALVSREKTTARPISFTSMMIGGAVLLHPTTL